VLIGYKLSWNQFSFAHPNQYELKSSPFAFVQKCGHGINLLKAMLSMRFVVHHPVKVDRKWRYCVRQPSTPHQMERSGLASRPGCFIPGKELPVPLERVAGTTWKNCRYHLKELPVPLERAAGTTWKRGLVKSRARMQAAEKREISANSRNPTRPSSTQPSIYDSINLLIRI